MTNLLGFQRNFENFHEIHEKKNEILWKTAKIKFGEMQRNDNLVDLEKCWKMRLLLLSEVSIQPIASPLKFDYSAEESEKDPVPDLDT